MRAIETEQLGKRYTLGVGGGYRTLGETIAGWRPGVRSGTKRAELWALRDIDLAIDEGESVGIIGRNGAGKSTLLKILSRVTEPTSGISRTRGRVGALLEVGTGFSDELTGRENIFLNAALMGMSRRETRRRFDDIVQFAEVDSFLDTPLKRYSTGMGLRLAFSVAAHLDPDIVVVDEVLTVGDAVFRQRCLDRISDLEREGRTVVVVSHDLGLVARMSRRVVWLDQGQIHMDGPAAGVIQSYLEAGLKVDTASATGLDRLPQAAAGMQTLTIMRSEGGAIHRNQPLVIAASFEVRKPVPELDLSIYVDSPGGTRILDEAWSDSPVPERPIAQPGVHHVELTVPPLLAAGEYLIGVWLGSPTEDFFDEEVLRLHVSPLPQDPVNDRSRVAHPHACWRAITAGQDTHPDDVER